jgi:hypothetical protein
MCSLSESEMRAVVVIVADESASTPGFVKAPSGLLPL